MTGHDTGTVLLLGDTVTLGCQTCDGNPSPFVKWTDTATNEELASSSSTDGSDCTKVELALGPTTPDMNGKIFECLATNGIGPARRESREFTVQCRFWNGQKDLITCALFLRSRSTC